MNEFHPLEYLTHIFADFGHRNVSLLLLAILYNFLEVGSTEFKDQVLGSLALIIFGVVNIEKLNHVIASSETIQDLVFATDILTRLSCSLYCHSFLVCAVPCLKHVTYK